MKNNQPLVSVVIPCYNHERFVKDSIQSVIDQTYKNIELIIIDDGSRDDSVLMIKELTAVCKERFIHFEFRSRPNIGLGETLNEALSWCKGKYFSVIASDDQMLKDKTTIQVNFLERNLEFVAVFGGVKVIDDNNKFIIERLNEDKQYSFKEIIMHEHDLPASTQMIRTMAIREVGGYDPSLVIEDWYMLLKLSMNSNIFYISYVFCLYRQHNSNISKNLVEIQKGRLDVLYLFKDNKYYKMALQNVRWINGVESLIMSKNKNIKKLLNLFLIDPKKTSKAVLKNIQSIYK